MNANHRAVSVVGVAVKRVLLGAFAALLIYFFCTPMGALRLAVFPWAPETAVSSQVQNMFDREAQQRLQKKAIPAFEKVYVFRYEDAPVARQTEGHMMTWKVYRVGPICWAWYFGEG